MSSFTGSDVDSLGFLSHDNLETSLYGETASSVDVTPRSTAASTTDDEDICLEGTLLLRKGRSTGHSSWMYKTCFVNLTFKQGGSIAVYRENPEVDDQNSVASSTNYNPTMLLRSVYSRIKKVSRFGADKDMYIFIPSHMPWVVKDVVNSHASFVIEIPTQDEAYDPCDATTSDLLSHVDGNNTMPENLPEIDEDEVPENLFEEMMTARRKGRPLRFYFRCKKGSPEKALWIRAFTRIGRFSTTIREKKGLFMSLASPLHYRRARVRTRTQQDAAFARATRQLEKRDTDSLEPAPYAIGNPLMDGLQRELSSTDQKGNAKEYKVLPEHAYPHRWMTREEMLEEMYLPSAHFHDLRMPHSREKEIGLLRVEVLECWGLPKLDRMSETDAVVYLVCGKYAFSTDVIANRSNPMWLRHTRRACIFPVHHAYARLFVGVFDDDDHQSKDDFAGRVVVNLAKLRQASTYTVMLPLRLSTHAFTRRKRGAIRLRFTLHYNNEREALLTYIPRNVNIPLPQHSKPNMDVTVACGDPKAFRNIALTVHGSHMTGRFTFPKVKAVIREMNFTRKTVINMIRREIFDIREWRTPAVSAYVFLAWMHCIYANAFSLVPSYVIFYFVLLLMRTYGIYGIDGPSQRGFVPPSWEELLGALVLGRSVRPLVMEERVQQHREISTHVPRFKRFLDLLGFIPEHDENTELDEHHLEFPFADGKVYPKFRVKECLAHRNDKESVKDTETAPDSLRMRRESNGEIRLIPRFDKDAGGTRDYDKEEENFGTGRVLRHTGKAAARAAARTATGVVEMSGINHVAAGLGHVVSPIKTGVENVGHMLDRQTGHHRREYAGSESDTASSTAQSDPLHPAHHRDPTAADSIQVREVCAVNSHDFSEHSGRSDASPTGSTSRNSANDANHAWADQDLEQNGPSTDKKLTDDLNESKDKMHEMTWHLFDDKVYRIDKDGEALFFGDAKKPEKRRKTLPKHLNKLLQVEEYSHSNPFVARLGLYVEPIVESSLSFLCMFRAIFNAATWQDPMLTFWIATFLSLLAAVLYVFPWRIFLFVVGLVLVGPQNYVIRRLREKGLWRPRKKRRRKTSKSDVEQGPVAYSHIGLDGFLGPRSRVEEADPREIQHVVVPYSPLMYQRFYDWPPEPQYAQVRAETTDPQLSKPDHIRNKSTSFGSVGGGTSIPLARRNLRRRFHRRGTSFDKDIPRGRPRIHTGDWQGIPMSPSPSP